MGEMPRSGVLVTELTASPQARELDSRGAVVDPGEWSRIWHDER